MKKFLLCLAVLSLLLAAASSAFALAALPDGQTPAAADESAEIGVLLDESPLSFPQPPIIIQGRVLVPLRAISEAFDAAVDWDGETQTVTAAKPGVAIKVQIGSVYLTKNLSVVALDVPAQIVNGSTLVPLRAIAEAFDCEVSWNAEERNVVILTAALEEPVPQDSEEMYPESGEGEYFGEYFYPEEYYGEYDDYYEDDYYEDGYYEDDYYEDGE